MMAEGKLQIEGEVIHVIVKGCYNFSKLLRHLTPSLNENVPLLILTRHDEKQPEVCKGQSQTYYYRYQ